MILWLKRLPLQRRKVPWSHWESILATRKSTGSGRPWLPSWWEGGVGEGWGPYQIWVVLLSFWCLVVGCWYNELSLKFFFFLFGSRLLSPPPSQWHASPPQWPNTYIVGNNVTDTNSNIQLLHHPPIDRTPGTPGSGKKAPLDCFRFALRICEGIIQATWGKWS